MANSIKRVEELVERYQHEQLVKKRLEKVKKEIFKEQEELAHLQLKVEDEYADIVHLEKKGIRQFFVNILVNKEEQLKKERQDYLKAVLHLKDCRRMVKTLLDEKAHLESKMIDSEIILDKIERKIEAIDESILYEESIHLSELKLVNEELKKLLQLKVETREALEVAKMLQINFLDMIKALNAAKSTDNWGKYYSEIQESKKNQKANIDKAHGHAQEIKRLVTFLKGEIEDVIEVRDEFRRTEAVIYQFNIAFYDHLLKDWIEASNLVETLTRSTSANANIIKMINALEGLIKNTEGEYSLLSKKKKMILQSLVLRKEE